MGKHLARRILTKVGKGFGYALLSIFVLVVVLFACINLPPVRKIVAKQVSSVLESSFAGKVVLHDYSGLGLSGVSGVRAEVFDAQGRRVVDAHGLTVRLPVLRIVWSALVQKADPLVIELSRISLRHGEVRLIDDGTGAPTLANAFAPKEKTEPKPDEPATKTIVAINALELEHAWIHGRLASSPPIDAEARGLRASLRSEPDLLSAKVDKLFVLTRGLPQAVDPRGDIQAEVRLPSQESKPKLIKARFRGDVLQLGTSLDAELDGKRVSAVVHVPYAPPERLRQAVPELRLKAPAEVRAKVTGELPRLTFNASVASKGAGRAELRGTALLEDVKKLDFELQISDADAAGFIADVPQTRLSLTVTSSVTVPTSAPIAGSVRVASAPSWVSGQRIPDLDVDASFKLQPKSQALEVDGKGKIHEPGAATEFGFAVNGRTDKPAIEAWTSTDIKDPPRLALFDVKVRGKLDTRLNVALDRKLVDASVHARLTNVAQAENRIDSVNLDGQATGPLAVPKLTAQLHANSITAVGRYFSEVRLNTQGSAQRVYAQGRVLGKDPERVQFATTVDLDQTPGLDDTRLEVIQKKDKINVAVDRVAFGKALQVKNARISGAGSAQASLSIGRDHKLVSVSASELDIAKLLRLVDETPPLKGAKLTTEMQYLERGRSMKGNVQAKLLDVQFDRVPHGTVTLDVAVDAGSATGNVDVNLDKAGKFVISMDKLKLASLSPAKLHEFGGKLTLGGKLDLAALTPLFTVEASPIERASGTLAVDVEVDDTRGHGLPDLAFHAHTRELEVYGKRRDKDPIESARDARSAAPWLLVGVDSEIDLRFEGNERSLALSARLYDRLGDLLRANAETHVPNVPLSETERLTRDAMRSPIKARVLVPPRELSKLPPLLRPLDLKGTLEFEVAADGSVVEPNVHLAGKVRDLRSLETEKAPLGLALRASYNPKMGMLALDATSKNSSAELRVDWDGELADLAKHDLDGRSPVKAAALVRLDRFPLEAIPMLSARHIEGAATGSVRLNDLGTDAKLTANVELRPLCIGDAPFNNVKAYVNAEQGKLRANINILEKTGSARAEVAAKLGWGDKVVPELVMPVDARLQAKHFRLAAIHPAIAGTVSEFDGRLDADLSVRFQPGAPVLKGQARLSEGVVHVPAVGQRFHDIRAGVRVAPGEVHIENVSAKGVTGKLTANAKARFAGLNLRSAEAHVRIPKDDKLPVTLEGVSMGDAWGKIDAQFTAGGAGQPRKITISVPEFTMLMPEQAAHSVQDLAPAEDIRIGVWRRDGELVTLPVQPLEGSDEQAKVEAGDAPPVPLIIDVKLGKNVWIERGTMATVQLTGQLNINSERKQKVQGQIQLAGGTLDIQGKRFDVEQGIVTFENVDPANPNISATARWDSPVGYSVYAEYLGTAKEGKLTLRSEPPLTEDEILSLLMFGSPDGAFGSGQGDSGATAVGIVGGTAAKGLNRALSSVTDLDVSARIDTSTGSARPELVVQISPRVSARVTRAIGEPGPGMSPDRTFLTLDFRIRRAWSLSTQLGDRGASALDLIWRHRY